MPENKNMAGVSRRGMLRGSMVLAGVGLATATAGRVSAQAVTPGFVHGVASGDPLPDRVIIWTRITPSADALPGSGVGQRISVSWQVAADPDFTNVVRGGTANTGPDTDHTVKVDVTGLRPDTGYFYRFAALGQTSATGRTRTAPATDADLSRLRFGVVSCSNWEAGYFASYRHLAERDDLDAIVHLGDYLYEYGHGVYGGPNGPVRLHDPAHEIVSLADYRIRHAQYKTDPDLMALHARVPFIATWDDHESADNAYMGGADNHDPAAEGEWGARKAASMQAYFEWMPVRVDGTGGDAALYRRFQFGDLAELSMLDLRSYRDVQASAGAGWRNTDSPDRTITGREQMDWLTSGIVTSSAQWKLVGNPVMIAPWVFPPLDTRTMGAITEAVGLPEAGIPYNTDQWDGYTADRRRLFDAISSNGVRNTVFLTGDIHTSWACDLPVNAADYPGAGTVGTEFIVPSVTSSNIDDILGVPPRTATLAAEEAIKSTNRHMRYVELDSHGFGVFEVNRQGAQMDWFYITDPRDPYATVRHAASYRVADGTQQARPVATPLDPAAYRPSGGS